MAQIVCPCGHLVEHGQVLAGVALDAGGDFFAETKEIIKGQIVISGIPASRLEGHYVCVVERLGPARTLKAMQKGLLPNLDPDALVDGRLTKFVPVIA